MKPIKQILDDFQRIPGVGKSIAQDFIDLGFQSVQEIRNQDPEKLYEQLCTLKKSRPCRCVLYVFRSAVYFASTPNPDSEKLLWYNWKDQK